jgi:hypothetical protein
MVLKLPILFDVTLGAEFKNGDNVQFLGGVSYPVASLQKEPHNYQDIY